MGKHIKYFILLPLFLSSNLFAQTSRPVIVHDIVGEIIEASERDIYDIFPGIPDFYSARFFRTDSNSISLEIQTGVINKTTSKTYPVSIFLVNQLHQLIEGYVSGKLTPAPEAIDIGVIEREQKRGREIFPGYAGSIFGGLMTLTYVYGLSDEEPTREEIYFVWGTGSALVSALGVQKAGEFDDGMRTYGAAFMGGLVGSGLGLLAFEGSLKVENPGLVVMVVLFIKPLLTSYFAIKGYYAAAKSRYRGVVNVDKSGASLGAPNFKFEKEESFGRNFSSYKLSILNISF